MRNALQDDDDENNSDDVVGAPDGSDGDLDDEMLAMDMSAFDTEDLPPYNASAAGQAVHSILAPPPPPPPPPRHKTASTSQNARSTAKASNHHTKRDPEPRPRQTQSSSGEKRVFPGVGAFSYTPNKTYAGVPTAAEQPPSISKYFHKQRQHVRYHKSLITGVSDTIAHI
eukprot:m.87386 g.87386  ORF g.87386 m.87386 type:complete len:170 (-) comp13582_c0_seq17:288-797(-)